MILPQHPNQGVGGPSALLPLAADAPKRCAIIARSHTPTADPTSTGQ
jgi:hypothetical protein